MEQMVELGDDVSTGVEIVADAAHLERSLTELSRLVLRMSAPKVDLEREHAIDRSGHWLLVHVAEQAPVRLSDLAESMGLDLSTVSRQARNLVASGLLEKTPDPADGRAALLCLSERGRAVLLRVSAARQDLLATALSGWDESDRDHFLRGLLRLTDALRPTIDHERTMSSVTSEGSR